MLLMDKVNYDYVESKTAIRTIKQIIYSLDKKRSKYKGNYRFFCFFSFYEYNYTTNSYLIFIISDDNTKKDK